MKGFRYYVLDGKNVIGTNDMMRWVKMMEDSKSGNRIVQKTNLNRVDVSTVFLGLDHNFGAGPPLLFETMIFGGPNDGYQERYETWEQAEAGHAKAVKVAGRVRKIQRVKT